MLQLYDQADLEHWSDNDNSLYRNEEFKTIGSVFQEANHVLGIDTPFYENSFTHIVHATPVEAPASCNHITHDTEIEEEECIGDCPAEDDFKRKAVKSWSNRDILLWINSIARELNVYCTNLAGEKFSPIGAAQLMEFSLRDFVNIDEKHGALLYDRFQRMIRRDMGEPYCYNQHTTMGVAYEMPTYGVQNQTDMAETKYEIHSLTSTKKQECYPSPTLLNQDQSQEKSKETVQPLKGKKGRPPSSNKRKKNTERLGRLWEFIRDLLKNREYCPSLIVWDNYEEGMFRFVHSDKVAKLWGLKKQNAYMNYEKLSRAMRYYYKSKVLLPVIGRRLVYKFGPHAHGWRVDNPNFKN